MASRVQSPGSGGPSPRPLARLKQSPLSGELAKSADDLVFSSSPRSPKMERPRTGSFSPLSTAHLRPADSPTTPEEENEMRRRAVSDAARLLRDKLQLELKRELLCASDAEARQHHWVFASFVPPVYCGICSKLCWGLANQGLKCSDCGLEIHRSCESSAPSCLGSVVQDIMPVARTPQPLAMLRQIRITVLSAEGLARRTLFRQQDPFVIISVDGKEFATPACHKTLSPVWNYDHDVVISISSIITLTIYDARRYQVGQIAGLMGTVIIPASAYLDHHTLRDGASATHTFRLKRRVPEDVVTGTVAVKFRAMRPSPPSPVEANSIPITAARSRDGTISPETPVPLGTSMGIGWQQLPSTPLPDSPFASFVPSKPAPPTCAIHRSGDQISVDVTWAAVEASQGDEIVYTLAVVQGDSDRPHDIYTGTMASHRAVGLRAGQTVAFSVKVCNFYGSSEFSDASEAIEIPKVTPTRAAERRHCPLFMAGYCFRGANCPLSHGTGLQTPDDVAAALLAASFLADPDTQMAVAIAASLSDMAQHNTFDESNLPQYKRDFHAKEGRLRKELPVLPGECRFNVSRADLFKSSFFEVSRRPPAELRQRLMVQFYGEGGLDYGGLAREWFFLLSHEIFHPSYGMFEYSRGDNYKLQINPSSALDADHLLYFQFVGRVLGMCVQHHHMMDAAFVVSFYKKMLGRPVTLSDLQDTDADVHRSLLWLLENDISEVTDMTFSVDYDHFGDVITHELIPNGANVQVTNGNKGEFVRLMVEWRLARGTEQQMSALLFGFHEIVPRQAVLAFSEKELEFLISGSQQFDLEDWAENTVYQGYTKESTTVKWLWTVIRGFDTDEQRQFLQFVTGSSRVPLEGFQGLRGSDGPRKFCVQKIEDVSRLPSAHTCFNRLDLPEYPTEAMLRSQLLLAMGGAQGFVGD
eukprot:m.225488 g.225488  ORF g.225488 m.225488 type:complete len:926 (-) comp11270_c0_seq1:199-2976(-)